MHGVDRLPLCFPDTRAYLQAAVVCLPAAAITTADSEPRGGGGSGGARRRRRGAALSGGVVRVARLCVAAEGAPAEASEPAQRGMWRGACALGCGCSQPVGVHVLLTTSRSLPVRPAC